MEESIVEQPSLYEKILVKEFITRSRIDATTAEVVVALRRRGIRAVLLKGPVVQRWLYAEDPWTRTYCDTDLLVAPGDLCRSEAVLEDLGFERPLHPQWLQPHAVSWSRPSDQAFVDLHRTLHGLETISEHLVWSEVIAGGESCVVAGQTVDIPGLAMRTLNVVMHVSFADAKDAKVYIDLSRALDRIDRATWQSAADLARRLGVDDEMGARLRLVDQGVTLADDLDLPAIGSLRSYGRAGLESGDLSKPATCPPVHGPPAGAGWLQRGISHHQPGMGSGVPFRFADRPVGGAKPGLRGRQP